jgi:hypothetical protein
MNSKGKTALGNADKLIFISGSALIKLLSTSAIAEASSPKTY